MLEEIRIKTEKSKDENLTDEEIKTFVEKYKLLLKQVNNEVQHN